MIPTHTHTLPIVKTMHSLIITCQLQEGGETDAHYKNAILYPAHCCWWLNLNSWWIVERQKLPLAYFVEKLLWNNLTVYALCLMLKSKSDTQ